jgi:hypothetical protein
MAGSGLMSKSKPGIGHLVPAGKHGVASEVADLRSDIQAALAAVVAVTVDDFTAPAAAGAATLKAATASVASVVTVLKAALLGPGLASLGAGRNITFTTAGTTAADTPATALITGLGVDGKAQTETVTLAQTATIAVGVKLFKDITSIVYPAADGTGATVAIGVGSALPLSKTPLARGGGAVPIREVIDGAPVLTGTISAANKSFTPATAPNATHNYACFYEFDATL